MVHEEMFGRASQTRVANVGLRRVDEKIQIRIVGHGRPREHAALEGAKLRYDVVVAAHESASEGCGR